VAALLYLVRTLIPAGQLSIIFTATRHHSEFLHALFKVNHDQIMDLFYVYIYIHVRIYIEISNFMHI
jgi:hypothetical protein